MPNKIKEILIASESKVKLFNIQEAKVEKGKGIVGDRYYLEKGSFSKLLKEKDDFHITFIEQEEIDAFNKKTNLNYSNDLFRRNIVTQGIKLNDLVGKRFKINDIEFLGMRLCEPCKFLSLELGEEFLNQMIHKAGLRARILSSGNFSVGESIEIL
ncbi:MAG: sulfurase [Arcobacter sp.]|nr:sulfurase [Arcobacter sp.]